MIKYTIQEIIDRATSFSLLEIVIQKECFLSAHLGLEAIKTLWLDTDPEGRFVSLKVTTSNESSVCASSGYSTREQLARGYFFEGIENIFKIKMRETKTK